MCQTLAEGGRRCADASVYSHQMRNMQAKKQYYARQVAQATSEAEKKKAEAKLEKAYAAVVDFAYAHEWHATPNILPYEMPVTEEIEKVLTRLRKDNLEPYIVGGSVRDSFLGLGSKDMDIEVYGAPVEDVIRSLRKLGKVDEVGKAFGVLKIRLGDEDIDVSLPRTDSKIGEGHRGFEIAVDPFMKPHKAALRRDFTINAMLYDHNRKVLLDPYNGTEDLKSKTLRHVSDAFDEDPLRVLRGIQMASRFGFDIHPDTIIKSRTLKNEFNDLATERVKMEFNKMFLKGKDSPKAFKALKDTEWDENFPGLKAVNNPELWKTLERVDNFKADDPELKISYMSALCVDKMNTEDAENFLQKTITRDDTRATARRLHVIKPPKEQGKTEMRRWAQEIGISTSIRQWVQLQEFKGNSVEGKKVYAKAEALGILDKPEPDFLLGRDILEQFPNAKPGKWMGQTLAKARAKQEEDVFRSKESAMDWLKNNLPEELK